MSAFGFVLVLRGKVTRRKQGESGREDGKYAHGSSSLSCASTFGELDGGRHATIGHMAPRAKH